MTWLLMPAEDYLRDRRSICEAQALYNYTHPASRRNRPRVSSVQMYANSLRSLLKTQHTHAMIFNISSVALHNNQARTCSLLARNLRRLHKAMTEK